MPESRMENDGNSNGDVIHAHKMLTGYFIVINKVWRSCRLHQCMETNVSTLLKHRHTGHDVITLTLHKAPFQQCCHVNIQLDILL